MISQSIAKVSNYSEISTRIWDFFLKWKHLVIISFLRLHIDELVASRQYFHVQSHFLLFYSANYSKIVKILKKKSTISEGNMKKNVIL